MTLTDNRLLKRLHKKAKRGMRGWPVATVAFYGPNLSQATKVAVGIVPSEGAEAEEMRDWHATSGDIRENVGVAQEILEFVEKHGARSIVMTGGIIGCPHQEKESTTKANGARFASSGAGAIALRGRCSIDFRGGCDLMPLAKSAGVGLHEMPRFVESLTGRPASDRAPWRDNRGYLA